MMVAGLVLSLGGGIDIVMMGSLASAEEAGIFSVAVKVAGLCSLSNYAITRLAAPAIAEHFCGGDPGTLSRYTRHIARVMFLTTLPLCLVVFLLPSFILGIFGREFTTGALALQVMVIAQLINAAAGPVGIFLQMTNREKLLQKILLFTVTLHCGINMILIPRFGMMGAAAANAMDLILWNLLAVFFIKRHHNFLTVAWPELNILKRPGR
jgi:O-antigen/teichoic acid export membrane protein